MGREKTIHKNLSQIKEKILSAKTSAGLEHRITIIGVTKTHSAKTLNDALRVGVQHIGENRVQEADKKFKDVLSDAKITKRMIGHLQKNKINKALEIFDTIDSVDTLSLAKRINDRTDKNNKQISVLLEVNTSGEKSKFGFLPENEEEMLACISLKNLKVKGLMTLGPLGGKEKETRRSFALLRNTRDKINNQLETPQKLEELSMGMSADYLLGIKEGSTMVRIGTGLFGERNQY